jgi:hypothetical protein
MLSYSFNFINRSISLREPNVMLKKFLYTSCLLISHLAVFAQLQSPNEFLPHKLGEHFTPHYMVVDYFQHAAENSDQVQLMEYGKTNQKRPLTLTFISTKENLANLEEIRKNNLRMTGLAKGQVDNSNPVAVVWMSFGVHGNEAAASESSINTLYQLLTKREAQEWLKNTVVIIDPSINPDGYSRYTHWVRNIGNKEADPHLASREHDEPWPGGRVNHYLFDLNRDWAWATQIESRRRLKQYQKWMPQIHVDFHEQFHNNPYYFAPAAMPFHPYITDWQSEFQYTVGKNNAKYFDDEGWLYFTREVFDLLYPSYGDTYPIFNGAIGMTYEQGGHSRAGRAIQLDNGDTLTLDDRIAHHTATALSTVETSSKNAGNLVQNFHDYFTQTQKNPPGEYKTFIIKGTNHPDKLESLMQFLDLHQIQYCNPESDKSVNAFHYQTGKSGNHKIETNDLIISSYQPKGILAQVLFEPKTEVVDSLTYDITAWALPYARGLEAYASKERVNVNFPCVQSKLTVRPPWQGEPYAYVAPWNSLKSAQFLSEILKSEVKVRFAQEPFELDGRKFNAGTLVITQADNRKLKNLNEKVANAAFTFDHELHLANTGFVTSGHDFGSDNMTFIKKPKVLVLSGERTFTNEFGQVWYYFEQDLNYPITISDADNLSQIDLDDFNLIVMPEGRFRLNDGLLTKLNTWIAGGGRLISIGFANRSLEDKKGFNLTKYAKKSDKSIAEKNREENTLENRTAKYKDRLRASISDGLPGAIFKINLDNSHPLGFGMQDYYFTLKTNTLRYDLLKNTWNVGYVGEDPMISGFVGSNIKSSFDNSVVFAVQNKGRGSITYMIDNPLFRAFWEEGKFLFSNAVFFVGQ